MGKKINVTNSLALSQLSCKIDDFSSEILDIVNAEEKGELYTKFVQQFLKYIPVDYRSRDKIELFGDFTYEAFEFFSNRVPGKRKIEIRVNEFQHEPAITILVATENKPFINDSLNSLLLKRSLQTVFTFYPVLSATRDKNGNLENIAKKEDGGGNESLVYIKILGTFDQEALESIKSEINNILDLVDYTYDSWQTLLNKIISITTDIVHHKDVYEKIHMPVEETLDFLNWLQKNNITFLGVVDFDAESNAIVNEEGVKDIWQDNLEEISTIVELSKQEYYKNKLVMLGKINKLSPVHRNALVDYILVKRYDENGEYKSGTIIFGLYGTAIYFQSIKSVPILRDKMNYVVEKSGFSEVGYNSKKIKNIIESLPRDTLIQIDESDLYCMCLHMLSSMHSHKLKLFIQQDWSNSFINVIVFLPREKLTPEVYHDISCYLKSKLGCKIISDDITVVAQNFSHLFVTIAVDDPSKLDFSHDEIEAALVQITTNWSEALLHKLHEKLGEYEGSVKHKRIEASFPIEYRHKFNSDITLDDLLYIEKASKSGNVAFNLTQADNNEFVLKFYSSEVGLMLSEMLPSIENLGFTAIDEQSFSIRESADFKQSWIYEFRLLSAVEIDITFDQLKHNVEETLAKVSDGLLTSDILNKLVVLSGFDWRQVKLMKAMTRYLHQTGFQYGKDYVQQILVKHSKFTYMLVELFAAKFHPKNHSKESAKLVLENISTYLDGVSSSAEDKIMQNMRSIVEAILRTNFYQNIDEEPKHYLSFKLDSAKVPDLPLPIPYAEIFVYSNDFEGVHLRGGKVARGGLRWSDRGEDYRIEGLGLMKAQMAKNTVIVPVGSKGAFYVNISQGELTQEEYMKKVIACYQDFLRGFFDVTDNLVHGKVVHPKNVVRYDESDPYLVVAADKGTASFSDYANAVSKEYKFWLGDAFASGGSDGYDHKKMGITAKGAWISAQSHFLEMGIDIQKEAFTVAGIGDMSGDVFGNGMLLSKCIKLVAAFNHQHIFLDPDPDCQISYAERMRLFKTPRSKWSDYNPEYISQGGGVFERSAKILNISKEIQDMLDLKYETITPDKLIQSILKSKVDLLWNGGIGTYIKSSSENNIDIGDKTNDILRVNGKEVRAKVIVEGGNLGLSQLGRIEYALSGGRINTDFIDNSAGVDCSDHEVNIKIALNSAVTSGKINIQERNDILEKMTNSVEELVLVDNYDQNLALTISLLSTSVNIESFSQLIRELENEGLLDSAVEFLPNKVEISRRAIANEGMTRSELSILLSYSKMSLGLGLADESFANDKYFEKHLFNYFPEIMRKEFKEEILNHPLRAEIIRTVIINKLVNHLGGALISSIKSETGGEAADIARAHAVVTEVFALEELWNKVASLGTSIKMITKVEMFSDLARIMRRGISWFIRNVKHPINIDKAIKEFSREVEELSTIISKLLVGTTKTRYFGKIAHYTEEGVEKKLAKSIATLEVLVSAFDIINIAKQNNTENADIANLYFETGDLFNIDWLRQAAEAQIDESYWNRLSIQSLKDDFYDKQKRLLNIIIASDKQKINLKDWLQKNSSAAGIFVDFVSDIKRQKVVNLNMIILANKKFEIFLRKIG